MPEGGKAVDCSQYGRGNAGMPQPKVINCKNREGNEQEIDKQFQKNNDRRRRQGGEKTIFA